jgi:hypothetical protein
MDNYGKVLKFGTPNLATGLWAPGTWCVQAILAPKIATEVQVDDSVQMNKPALPTTLFTRSAWNWLNKALKNTPLTNYQDSVAKDATRVPIKKKRLADDDEADSDRDWDDDSDADAQAGSEPRIKFIPETIHELNPGSNDGLVSWLGQRHRAQSKAGEMYHKRVQLVVCDVNIYYRILKVGTC